MINELTRKKIAREHAQRLNAGDVDGLLALYAADATIEDPVGTGTVTGREALRAHFEIAAAGHVHETIEDLVAGQDGRHVVSRVTAVMDYHPRGPEYAARGWLPERNGAEPTSLRCHYALLLRVGESGLIEHMRAFWGRPDLEISTYGRSGPFRGPDVIAPRDAALRRLPQIYLRTLEDGEVDKTVALFTDDVVFEDPVGSKTLVGREVLREHVTPGSEGKVQEALGRPVSSMDGRFVVIRGDARLLVPVKLRMRMITLCELNEEGLGVHIQAFWGVTDVTLGLPEDPDPPYPVDPVDRTHPADRSGRKDALKPLGTPS